MLLDGASPAFDLVDGSATSQPVLEVHLPSGESATVRISSIPGPGSLNLLGVWDWISSQLSGTALSQVTSDAQNGQVWMLSPYLVLRLVHAVRLPLLAPRMQKPTTFRQPGATSVDI